MIKSEDHKSAGADSAMKFIHVRFINQGYHKVFLLRVVQQQLSATGFEILDLSQMTELLKCTHFGQ